MNLYHLHTPSSNAWPLIASLPHSGIYVPHNVENRFSQAPGPILAPVDWYLDRLYDFLPELGITMLQATHSRYVVNLNRGLEKPLFGPEPTSIVPDKTCFGRPLYDSAPYHDEIEERVNRYYVPYHQQLLRLLHSMLKEFGRVYLLDLHSYYRGPEVDVCLGNVDETTCSERLIGNFESIFRNYSFTVIRNEKWIGGHITRHYGNMDKVEALQIELRFPAYLDGDTFEEDEVPDWDSEKFRNTKRRLRRVFIDFVDEFF